MPADRITLARLERESILCDTLSHLATRVIERIDAGERPEESELAIAIRAAADELCKDLETEIERALQPTAPPEVVRLLRSLVGQLDQAANEFSGLHTHLQSPIPEAAELWERHRLALLKGFGQALEAIHGSLAAVRELVKQLSG